MLQKIQSAVSEVIVTNKNVIHCQKTQFTGEDQILFRKVSKRHTKLVVKQEHHERKKVGKNAKRLQMQVIQEVVPLSRALNGSVSD